MRMVNNTWLVREDEVGTASKERKSCTKIANYWEVCVSQGTVPSRVPMYSRHSHVTTGVNAEVEVRNC